MERFGNKETRLIWDGNVTKTTRRTIPSDLHRKAQRLISFVLEAERPADCGIFPEFKMLHGTRRGWYQFRIGGPYRIRFQWNNGRAVMIIAGEFHDKDE